MALKFSSLKLINQRRVIIFTGVLLMLVLLFTFAPTYVARYLIASTLDDFGIEHEGIKTVKINLWKREVWAGPVRFRTGDADHGQLGELGIKVRVMPVFEKHAMIEQVLIRGIDIFVARGEDNTLSLNGIPLQQFRPTTETAEITEAEKQSDPWGAGLHEFEIQDSRIIFKEKTGGTLTVKIEKLRLGDFTSWLPDEPGSFQLKASVNDIALDLKGSARPFASQITLSIDAETRDAELPKVIEFTGPLFGLERRDGVHNSTLQHEITLFDTGRIEGRTSGNITVLGADYAKADRFALATEKTDIALNTRYSLSETNDLQIDAKLTLDIVKASGKLPGENTFSLNHAWLELAELSTAYGADNALHIEAKPQVKVQQGTYSGRIQLSMDAFMDVLRYLQSISSQKNVTSKQTGMDKWAGDEVTLPKSDIAVKQLDSSYEKFELNTTAGNVTLDIESNNEVSGLNIVSAKRNTRIDNVRIKFDTLQLRSGEGKSALKLDGDSSVIGVGIKGPIGNSNIKALTLSQNIELQINQGDISVQGAAQAGIDGTQLNVHKMESLPQAKLGIGAIRANIKKASFSLAKQKVQWQVDGGTTIDRVSAEYAKGKISAAKIQRLEWRGARANQDLNLATDALVISGLNATVTRQFIDGVIDSVASESPGEKKGEDKDEDEKLPKQQPTSQPGGTKTQHLELKMGRFELANGAKLRYLDKKVRPPIIVDLDIQTAEVRNIDSRNPSNKAHAKLLGKINEFTHIELNGEASNEGPNMDLTLSSKLENLELPPYSPYAAEFAGVNLESGQFNTHVDVSARKGDLDGAIKLHIKALEFTPLSEADAERLSETTGVPIDTATSLLKDRHGNIDLALPVSGTVFEPKVDISSAISKAIGNTLRVVFPPTLIASILASASEEGGMTFKPILFKPGSAKLGATAREYLDELGTLFKERPSLSLNICGRMTPEDFEAVTLVSIKLPANPKPAAIEARERLIKEHGPKLLELAIDRTRIVRRYLITEKGIDTKQVGECRSTFNPDDKEPPRVVVTL